MKFFTSAIALFSLSWQALAQYPDPLPCAGVCNNTQDPSLIQRASDGTWFRFSTSHGISIHSAPTGLGPWEYRGVVLANGCSVIDLPGNCDVWAPDVSLVGDTYYLYYAVSVLGSQTSAIGVATSKDLDVGSWTDHGSTGLESSPDTPYNAIDPNLIQLRDRTLLTFGSYWQDVFNVDMAAPPLKLAENPMFNHLAFNTTDPHSMEGAFMYTCGRYFYLFFSTGACCGYNEQLPPPGAEYRILVCRSEDSTSGFVDANGVDCLEGGGTEVLASHGHVYGPGGQGVVEMEGYGPVLYYHYADPSVGLSDAEKLVGVNQVEFGSGWPVLV